MKLSCLFCTGYLILCFLFGLYSGLEELNIPLLAEFRTLLKGDIGIVEMVIIMIVCISIYCCYKVKNIYLQSILFLIVIIPVIWGITLYTIKDSTSIAIDLDISFSTMFTGIMAIIGIMAYQTYYTQAVVAQTQVTLDLKKEFDKAKCDRQQLKNNQKGTKKYRSELAVLERVSFLIIKKAIDEEFARNTFRDDLQKSIEAYYNVESKATQEDKEKSKFFINAQEIYLQWHPEKSIICEKDS